MRHHRRILGSLALGLEPNRETRDSVCPQFLRSGPNPEPRTPAPRPLTRWRWRGKVSSDLQAAFRRRPDLFAQLIRELKNLPDRALLRIVREVRDGEW